MQIGAFARTAERTLDGQRIGFADIQRLAVAAEAVGLDSFWLPDHLLFYPPEGEPLGCWEVFTFLSAIASTTRTLTLGTFVAAALFRNPALLAKMAAALDEISDGRFVLGLGAGNWEKEHVAFGYPFDHRAGRFAEAIQIIAPLLRDGSVNFHGRYYRAPECVLRPRGPSPSGPPIWIGAKGEQMLRITATHADALIAIWPITPEQVAQQHERLVAACEQVGRDPATIGLTAGTWVQLPVEGQPTHSDRAISGSYEEIAAALRSFAAAGVQHLVVDFRQQITTDVLAEFGQVLRLLS